MREEQQKIVLEDDSVSKLLGGLKRVEAPGDFDFRVKARIAKGRPVDRPTPWLPAAVRLAVPLGLLLTVGGYFGYDAFNSLNNVAVAPVVEMPRVATAPVSDGAATETAAMPANQNAVERLEIKPPDLGSKATARQKEKRIVLSKPANKQSGGGSYVTASRTPRQIFAKGSAKDVLTSIGIDADSTWKVASVKQNSVAERSGLKSGDVIEAVNDQPLTDKTAFGTKFSGKSVRVLRDGKSVQIDLKP